jgi:uncharacterized membrane protein HdeD (DUF308 family)
MHVARSFSPLARPARDAPVRTDALRRGRRRLMIAGTLALLLGAGAIVVPTVASVATAVFIGWILVLGSFYQVVDAFSVDHGGRRVGRLLLAALTLAAGLYLLLAPLSGTFTLTVMLVLWFVAVGVVRMALGASEFGRDPEAGVMVLGGALELLLGLLIAERLPSSASWAIGLLVGIDLLVSGASLIGLALSVRRLERAA